MASEAVMLGTHALYVNEIRSGSTKEQQERYALLYCFHGADDRYTLATEKAMELLSLPDLQTLGQEKRQTLLREKSDINGLFIAEIDRLAKTGDSL